MSLFGGQLGRAYGEGQRTPACPGVCVYFLPLQTEGVGTLGLPWWTQVTRFLWFCEWDSCSWPTWGLVSIS